MYMKREKSVKKKGWVTWTLRYNIYIYKQFFLRDVALEVDGGCRRGGLLFIPFWKRNTGEEKCFAEGFVFRD